MSNNVTTDNFAEELKSILDDYGKEVHEVTNEALDQVAKETLKDIRQNSPKGSGKYRRGWKKKKTEYLGVTEYEIYNATSYQLTHLLEFGHDKWVWGKNTGQRVAPRPHIRPAEVKAERNIINKIKSKI